MKKSKIYLPVLMAMVAFLAGSCRKNVVDNVSENDSRVYITRYDSTANFSGYQSFRVADSVSIIKNGIPVQRAYTSYDSSMLAAVSQAMIQRGYTLVTDKTTGADLGIHVSRVYNDYTGIISYDNYWSAYGNYLDPYYWGYGGYGYYFPYALGTYTVRDGAISVDMIDLENPDKATNKLRSIWSALGKGTSIFNVANVSEEVQSSFGQSPYIQK